MIQLNNKTKFVTLGFFLVAAVLIVSFNVKKPQTSLKNPAGLVTSLDNSQVAGVNTEDAGLLNPLAFQVPDYFRELPTKLGETVSGSLGSLWLDPKQPVARLESQDGWLQLGLAGAKQQTEPVIENGKAVFREVGESVDIDYRFYDGLLRQLITLQDKKADKEFIFSLELSQGLELGESTGGYLPVKNPATGEEIFMLKAPQGIGVNGARVDYEYKVESPAGSRELNKSDRSDKTYRSYQAYTIKLVPARASQFAQAEYPVKIDSSLQAVAWDEALVKVGENGRQAGNAKDGDILAIKPAGWNWGTEERKRFVIVRVPKLALTSRDEISSRLIDGAVKYAIDYTKLATPQQLTAVRDPKLVSPTLDATMATGVIQEKPDPLSSLIPAEQRLAYQPSTKPSIWKKLANKIFKPARAVTIRVSSIGSASRNYSTLQSWEDAVDGDLVSQDVIQKGEAYKDSTFTAGLTIDGSTTDATRYLWLSAPQNERHLGTTGSGVKIDPTASGDAVTLSDPYTIFEYFLLTDWATASAGADGINGLTTNIKIRNNIVYENKTSNGYGIGLSSAADNSEIYNNIVYDSAGASSLSSGIYGGDGVTSALVYNNTVYGAGVNIGLNGDLGQPVVRNNIAMTTGSSNFSVSGSWGANTSHNISSDTTAPGTSSHGNQTAASLFVDSANKNFHLLRGSLAIDNGVNLSGTFADDINGVTRGGNWDIGADELPCQANWWHCNWLKRRKITFDTTGSATTSSLVNYPAAVLLNNTRIDFNNASTSDIRFVDANGSSILEHEIEKWDETSTSTIWVKVPQIDQNSNTDYIWVYYGNSQATSSATTTGVWDDNFRLIQHLEEGDSTVTDFYKDSTKYGNDGTLTDADGLTVVADGKLDGALDYEGDADVMNLGTDSSIKGISGSMTLSAWFKGTSNDASVGSVMGTMGPSGQRGYMFGPGATGNMRFDIAESSTVIRNAASDQQSASVMQFWTGLYHTADPYNSNNPSLRLFLNGLPVAATLTSIPSSQYTGGSSQFQIGNRGDSLSTSFFNGIIDEARISNVARDWNWIAFDYCNMVDTCVSYGAEEEQQVPVGAKFR